MEVLDIGIKRPVILPPTIIMIMVFMTMEVLDCILELYSPYLGLNISATLPLSIVEFIVKVIEVATMKDIDFGLMRPTTIPLSIVE